MSTIATGITPLDERTGGVEDGGTYLVVGAPGPAKMVAALQFLHAGIRAGETGLLLTNADIDGILSVARAWGFDFDEAWENGLLQVVGFRDDFELRAMRSIEPEKVLDELDEITRDDPDRIAVDPGGLFLSGGAKTLLASAFMSWSRRQPGTLLATFSVDGDATNLPSSADWLVNATTARLVLERRSEGLYQITIAKALPGVGEREETVSLELKPGFGLVGPESYPTRRGVDRAGVDRNRLLLVSLGGEHAADLETWAERSFQADVVAKPFEAVAKVQDDAAHGCVLVYAPRKDVRDAVHACRALRPLTRAAIVFASDDAIRSTDRVHLLEAGADDCLTGGVDFRELALRIKQSMAAGAKPTLPDTTESAAISALDAVDGGKVSAEVFLTEVDRRADDPNLAFFCVLDVSSKALDGPSLEDALNDLVRSEEGDLVSGSKERCLVLLQGAREGQLAPFIGRLHGRLDEAAGGSANAEVTILSHPADAFQIQKRLGASGGEEA